MAIQNASDLLVYKITTPAQAQVTRIKVKSSTPLNDFTSGDYLILNNITDDDGDITDGNTEGITGANTGTNVLSVIAAKLATFDYTATAVGTDGVWKYRDFTNGANGPVPTLEVVDGTAEFKVGAVVIDVLTSGQSEVYQPIAYSTSASLSMSTDLRDITTKDSPGWQENAKGLSSFEMSTDALWDVNNAVGVESAINDLDEGAAVDVKFSDRVRNLVDNEAVSGEGWYVSTNLDQTKHLEDPFGQYTATKYKVNTNSGSINVYQVTPIVLVEGKIPTYSIYIKGSGSCTAAWIGVYQLSGSTTQATNPVAMKLSGAGSVGVQSGNLFPITGLSTSEWTRVQVSQTLPISGADLKRIQLNIYPGGTVGTQTTADEIIIASCQLEIGTTATDYQNPTEVNCYQGKALVNSVSVDAGTEENATYSASFTGTSELFVNGLGPELLSNTYLDGVESGTTTRVIDGWTIARAAANCLSNFENPGGHLEWSNTAETDLKTSGITLVADKEYELTYTVSALSNANTRLKITLSSPDYELPLTVATHTVRLKMGGPLVTSLRLQSVGASGSVTFSHISLKEVFS